MLIKVDFQVLNDGLVVRLWIPSILAIAGILLACTRELPTDGALQKEFTEHYEVFSAIADMTKRELPDVERIDREENLVGTSVSASRLKVYADLLDRVNCSGPIIRRRDGEIRIICASVGFVTGGVSKGFVYSPKSFGYVTESLDDLSGEVEAMKHIAGDWYLFYYSGG